MRKLYSLVLIAAGLLIGTNSWAQTTLTELQTAFNNPSVTAFVLQSDLDAIQFDGQLVLNMDQNFVLDLNGKELKMNNTSAAKNAAILIKRGRLEIKNGTISNESTGSKYTSDLIRVVGSTEEIDAKEQTPYSQVIVAADATLKNEGTASSSKKLNVLSIFEVNTTAALANGARIDVYGEVVASTYGIKVNGTIKKPANVNHSPYVYIHKGATVGTSNTNGGAAAVYSSGYGRWRIEGTCEGSTGLYAKGGSVEIVDNAQITSTNNDPNHEAVQTGKTSGISAGGSAIVVESNANYPGQISVVISGNAQITGSNGYAIEQTVDNAVTDTKVESISIQGGTIKGGSAGAIIVDEKTAKDEDGNITQNVTVVGGNIDGTIEIEGQTTTAVTVETFINGTTTSNPGEESDYLVTKDGNVDENPTYTVTPNTSKVVTMNAYGYTTFSAAYARAIKAADTDLKAYTATFNDNAGEYTLSLTPISTPIYANSGVVFIGTPNKTYALEVNSETGTLNSALKPAAEWSSEDAANGIIAGQVHENAYVLSGNMMYKYEGANMKANKAYLDLGAGSGAPKRIRMVVTKTEESQAVENVAPEAVKAVKFVGNDGKLYIRRGEAVYTVQGQLVK